MTTYYLDTSALTKRYVQETGSEWIEKVATAPAGNTLVLARTSMVELHSALARRKREGTVSSGAHEIALRAFTLHCATDYDFVDLDLKVVALARDLLDRNALRAYDAIQLASAILSNQALLAAQLPPLIFVSADDRLNGVAAVEGLAVENPNRY